MSRRRAITWKGNRLEIREDSAEPPTMHMFLITVLAGIVSCFAYSLLLLGALVIAHHMGIDILSAAKAIGAVTP